MVAGLTRSAFHQLNAVSSGVRDVREVLDRASAARRAGKKTILFIDEIHRFNKAQQDALLHSVEEGLVTLIGATTENPSFEVIGPLLSRCRVYVLEPLDEAQLRAILHSALARDPVLAAKRVTVSDPDALVLLSGGDARAMLNGLETAAELARPGPDGTAIVGRKEIEEAFQRRNARYDRDGEQHYSIVSAFIKSMRGSDPDAAVYWLARMIAGGEDPLFIARRMVILASEDVGNADPSALPLAVSCFQAVEAVGMPEGRIVLAQTAAYLASAPKSNASYTAINEALADVAGRPEEPVPLHLRNAPTRLMEGLGYGREYRYAHDHPGNFVEQEHLPPGLRDRIYYRPTGNGAESSIRERLNRWWKSRQR
jgi:putative ATPase